MNIRTLAVGTFVLSTAIGTAAPALGQCEPRWVPDLSPGGVGGDFPATVHAATYFDPDGDGPLGSQLLIGGRFSRAGGSSASVMATWDGVSWKPMPDSILRHTSWISRLLTTRSGRVVGAGQFVAQQFTAPSPVAFLENDTWDLIDPNLSGTVEQLCEARDGTIHALGYFGSPVDFGTRRIMRLDRSGSTSVPCSTDGVIKFIAGDPGGAIVAGGRFSTIEGVPANGLARWDGTRWSSFDAIQQCSARLDFQQAANGPNGDLIVGGSVGCLSETDSESLVRWDGSTWTSMGNIFCPELDAIAAAGDGTVYVLGGIVAGEDAGTVARWNGERWNIIAGSLYTFDTSTLAARDRSCAFVGGSFSTIDEVFARGAALWEHNRWNCMGGDDRFTVQQLWTIEGLGAVASGSITDARGIWSVELAVWSNQGWRLLGIQAPASFSSLARDSGGHLIAAINDRDTPGGESIVRRWSGSNWIGIGSGLTGEPTTILALPAEEIVVTGNLSIDGTPCMVAHWNGLSWSQLGSISQGRVRDAARMSDGTLVIGGMLCINESGTCTPLASWNGQEWTDITSSRISGEATALGLIGDGVLVVAGYLYSAADTLSGDSVFAWDGQSLRDLNAGLDESFPWVADIQLDVDGAPLLIGTAGAPGIGPRGINRWNGHSWESIGGFDPFPSFSGGSSFVASLGVHANGDLLIFGNSVTATNTMGPRSSLCYSRSPAPRMAQSPSDLTINADDQIVLSAAVIMNLDEVSYQWYRNGVAINSGPGGASESGGIVSGARGTIAGRTDDSLYTLRITNATPGDTGDYTISFTNPCGTVVSRAATVIVRCSGDFNSDGGIDGSDIEAFFAAWEQQAIEADVDLDRRVDEIDVTEFFARWSAGSC